MLPPLLQSMLDNALLVENFCKNDPSIATEAAKAAPLRKLFEDPDVAPDPGEFERHSIYSLLLLAITYHYFNPNKRGRAGPRSGVTYGYPPPAGAGGNFLDSDYIGHNICALIVDGAGEIIDFDFNHNEIFNSSVEHAESRLVRRAFSMSNIFDTWNLPGVISLASDKKVPDNAKYSKMLKETTVYTTLESCAQCSGVMMLAGVGTVVYLQADPSQYKIGNVLRNLTGGDELKAPLPISGTAVGFAHTGQLDADFESFFNEQQAMAAACDKFPKGDAKNRALAAQQFKYEPYHTNGTNPFPDISITSYLTTSRFLAVCEAAAKEFEALFGASARRGTRAELVEQIKYPLKYPCHPHTDANEYDKEKADVKQKLKSVNVGETPVVRPKLTNHEVLIEAGLFYDYAVTRGRRASSHKD